MKVIIIGGVAGGASAAARLRRLDENAQIILLERGEHISFANCGLPYYIGGAITERDALTLQTPQSFNGRFCVDVRNFSEAVSIDRKKKTVLVKKTDTGETYEESYDKLVLSPGAAPFVPPIDGADCEGIFTLRNIPDTFAIEAHIKEHQPKQAIVVGGGFIGVEMAENLVEAGLEVTLVEFAPHIIASLDAEMAADVQLHMRQKGVKLLLGDSVTAVKKEAGGLTVSTKQGKQLSCGIVIMAVGVRPETKLATDAGLELTALGSISVNSHMQTSDPDIFAVGDAIGITNFVTGQPGNIPLAGPANKQGRIAADNICGIPSEFKGTQGSAILKVFDMTVASTGLNERSAKSAGIDYEKVYLFPGSHAGYYPGGTNMQMKVLFEKKTGRVIGAQVAGFDGVDKRCDVIAASMRFGATARELAELELCYAPPYSSAKDPVNMAGFIMENIMDGRLKQFHWHDIPSLPRDGSVTLLDVRTEVEYKSGSIDGFVNIPLDSLRQRIGELDASKPVYVHCHSGLRSYVACCLLQGHGFDCYNLSGGYRLYSVIESEKKAALQD